MKTEFKFTATSRVTLTHEEGEDKSLINYTDVRLDVSNNLRKSQYLDENDLPTEEGAKALTIALCQGLVATVRAAHKYGYWDEADHMKYIYDELQSYFEGDPGEVITSTM